MHRLQPRQNGRTGIVIGPSADRLRPSARAFCGVHSLALRLDPINIVVSLPQVANDRLGTEDMQIASLNRRIRLNTVANERLPIDSLTIKI